jgi:hypothetical protein
MYIFEFHAKRRIYDTHVGIVKYRYVAFIPVPVPIATLGYFSISNCSKCQRNAGIE